jgi:diaminohydroxyphosphoribosylaminopyrimidine deaminase/5-amino-6-(5-phosphoribosylamino)uracil reductase
MVGAVVVKDGAIIGQGYHRRFGGPHAEVYALTNVKEDLKDATLYVTLEPCCHFGKTPPCVNLIIEKQVGRVVVGTIDPNPLVAGKGIRILRDRGIRVNVGVLENQCRELNETYFKYFETGLPFVTLKMAQSLDSRIATKTGSSQWISSPDSLKLAHRWRAHHDAVMVGIDTVLIDNPSLTVRLAKGETPLRVVVDSQLRIPLNCRVLSDGHGSQTIVLTTHDADLGQLHKIEDLGARVFAISANPEGQVDLAAAMRRLAGEGIRSILVEGGARLATSLLKAGLVDKLLVVIAPKIIGKGIEAVGDLGIVDLHQALVLSIERTRRVGEDLVVVARPKAQGKTRGVEGEMGPGNRKSGS